LKFLIEKMPFNLIRLHQLCQNEEELLQQLQVWRIVPSILAQTAIASWFRGLGLGLGLGFRVRVSLFFVSNA
jgi:hypothetical protein